MTLRILAFWVLIPWITATACQQKLKLSDGGKKSESDFVEFERYSSDQSGQSVEGKARFNPDLDSDRVILDEEPTFIAPATEKKEDIQQFGEIAEHETAKINLPPVVRADSLILGRNTGVTYQISADDPNSDDLHFTILDYPEKGNIEEFDSKTGTIRYVHDSVSVGIDSFSIVADDGEFFSKPATIRIDITNDAPEGRSSQLLLLKNRSFEGNLEGKDTDEDSLKYLITSYPRNGQIEIDEDTGRFLYTPRIGFSGDDDFQYVVNDGVATSDSNLVEIKINNKKPEIFSTPSVEHELLPPEDFIDLSVTFRDMYQSHPDFEVNIRNKERAAILGMVEDELDEDGKPVFNGMDGFGGVSSGESFAGWFRDVPGVNKKINGSLRATRIPNTKIYRFEDTSFFPLDNVGFGNEGNSHNYHFTLEIERRFRYRGGETFSFTGDDDVWVFINNKLAVDLGGIHPAISTNVSLDEIADRLEIVKGSEYSFKMFFVERKKSQSNFLLHTSIVKSDSKRYQYQILAKDPDGDPLSYSLVRAPENMSIDENTGLILWDATEDQLGKNDVTVKVSDGDEGIIFQNFTIDTFEKR